MFGARHAAQASTGRVSVRAGRYGRAMTATPATSTPAAAEPACRIPGQSLDNPCPRCGEQMLWTKASWHCLACRYKEGCC